MARLSDLESCDAYLRYVHDVGANAAALAARTRDVNRIRCQDRCRRWPIAYRRSTEPIRWNSAAPALSLRAAPIRRHPPLHRERHGNADRGDGDQHDRRGLPAEMRDHQSGRDRSGELAEVARLLDQPDGRRDETAPRGKKRDCGEDRAGHEPARPQCQTRR